MIDLHKNVFNMLANQKTGFISSRNWKNIGKKEVKEVRKSQKWKHEKRKSCVLDGPPKPN